MFSFPVFVQTHATQEAWGVIYFAVHMYNEDFSPCHWLAAAASSHLHHGNSVWIVSLEASSIIGSGVSVLSLSLSLSQGSNIQWYQQQFRRVHDGSSLYWTSVSTLIIQSFESSVAARLHVWRVWRAPTLSLLPFHSSSKKENLSSSAITASYIW